MQSDIDAMNQSLNNMDGYYIPSGKTNYYLRMKSERKNPLKQATHILGKIFGGVSDHETVALVAYPSPAPPPFEANAPNRASMKLEASTLMAPAGLEEWQAILYAHARHDTHGNPVDGKGHVIDLRDINSVFGQKLAETCLKLDEQGYAGKYEIISGVRSREEQAAIYNHYKSIGSDHPVALPGNSLHEIGCAADISCTSGDAHTFYQVYAQTAQASGLEGVANDPQHRQLSRQQIHNFIMSQPSDGKAKLASLSAPRVSFEHAAPVT
jgi:hypothetical protein